MNGASAERVSRRIERASALWNEGALRACLETLIEVSDVLARAPNLAPPERRDGVAIQLGAVLIRLGQPAEATEGLSELFDATGSGYAALHLGAAYRLLGEPDLALGLFETAFAEAKRDRDGVLAIATLCERGAQHLARDAHRAALESYGEALGLTEFTRDPRPSVAPLAGLAVVHAREGRARKAEGLARRALERSEPDRVGRARALIALAECSGDARSSAAAAFAARVAPHVPLWVAEVARRPDAVDTTHRGAAAAAAAGLPALAERLHRPA